MLCETIHRLKNRLGNCCNGQNYKANSSNRRCKQWNATFLCSAKKGFQIKCFGFFILACAQFYPHRLCVIMHRCFSLPSLQVKLQNRVDKSGIGHLPLRQQLLQTFFFACFLINQVKQVKNQGLACTVRTLLTSLSTYRVGKFVIHSWLLRICCKNCLAM